MCLPMTTMTNGHKAAEMHATNTITTLAQAEAYAASTKARYSNPLPSFATYKEGVENFLRESAEWEGLDQHYFYSVNRYGYSESSDNAAGGLDVSWAFQASRSDPENYTIRLHYHHLPEDGVRRAMQRAEVEYIRLCEEDRALAEENEN